MKLSFSVSLYISIEASMRNTKIGFRRLRRANGKSEKSRADKMPKIYAGAVTALQFARCDLRAKGRVAREGREVGPAT